MGYSKKSKKIEGQLTLVKKGVIHSTYESVHRGKILCMKSNRDFVMTLGTDEILNLFKRTFNVSDSVSAASLMFQSIQIR